MSNLPDSKRQRISRACDQCRRRKSKCDGLRPVCSICRSARRSCTYQTSGRRRGLQSGYVKALQTILGVVIQHAPSSETVVKSVLRDANARGNFLGSEQAERYIAAWRSSKLSKETMQILDPTFKDTSQDDDLEWEPTDTLNDSEEITLPTQTFVALLQQQNDITAWPLPENIIEIVEFYFSHIHSWFPILERHDILRAVHSDPASAGDSSAGYRLTLWTIILYVSVAQGGITSERSSWRTHIQTLLQLQIFGKPETVRHGHIEALLILVLLDMGLGNISSAWVQVGQAARIIVLLPVSARERRYDRMLRCCVFLDTILSALTDQDPCLSLATQAKYKEIDENGLEEWDMWNVFSYRQKQAQHSVQKGPLRALSALNMDYQLTQHLTRILHWQSDKGSPERLVADLHQWKQALSRRYPASSSHTPALLTLHLASNFVTLCLMWKCLAFNPSILNMARDTVRSTLDLLDCYIEIAGTPRSSPLLRCLTDLGYCGPEKEEIIKRATELGSSLNWLNNNGDCWSSIAGSSSTALCHSLGPLVPATTLPQADSEHDDLISSDTMFEEMVTSLIPTEIQPTFAQNLGFCAGDMDLEFLDSLRQSDHE
ncbi:hypothetical protein BDV59DRAFT_207617 [Aspergillus ambiguus]|uniref:uncharacterized protein n=1 Tax=Aspergillus ambiguus TaxID=176160 RepID=UPI003CCC9A76